MSHPASNSSHPYLPSLVWLKSYRLDWLRGDLIAGLITAAYMIPASIGDASLASLPPQAGLYACLFSGLVFWLFTSVRHTSITVTSAISLLVGSTLGPLAAGDPARMATMASTCALIVAALALAAKIFRAGSIVSFISEPVMTGFKCGVALHLTASQLPKLFGFHGSHGDFWERIACWLQQLHQTNLASLLIGSCALCILAIGKLKFPKFPMALVVVCSGLALGAFCDLNRHGVSMLGEVPQGLPHLGFHQFRFEDLRTLLPLSMACFLLASIETAAIGRMFARKHGYRMNSDQEFLALATANLASSLGQGFPTSGGMSQSLVNESSGAKTPLSGLFTTLLILIVILFFSGLLRHLPQPILAAIVMIAVISLLKIDTLRQMWSFSRADFAVAMTALIGVLSSGLLMGVLYGAILSLILLVRRAMHPHSTELGRVPESSFFADCLRHPENQRIPGVFVFRNDSAILYFNADHVRERFFDLLQSRPLKIHTVIFHLGSVPLIDFAGVELLDEIRESLAHQDIRFRIAEAHSGVRDTLRRAGFEKHYGPIRPDQTVDTILSELSAPTPTPTSPQP